MSFPIPIPSPPPTTGLASAFSSFWSTWVIPSFGQQAIWLQRITSDMVGAVSTAAWDTKRANTISFNDGSYGVGWQLGGRMGYLAPQTIQCARNDNYRQEEISDAGLIIYQGPVVLYQPAAALSPLGPLVVLRKGDVLIFSSGILYPQGRFVVGDAITPAQVMGQTVITGAKLEERSSDDIVQSIPLT